MPSVHDRVQRIRVRVDVDEFLRRYVLLFSFEGSVAVERKEWNQAYYGKAADARAIVIGRKFSNAAADGLRRALAIE